MEIKDMSNEMLLRYYGCKLEEIEYHYKQKKDFEEEIKKRFKNGLLKEKEGN